MYQVIEKDRKLFRKLLPEWHDLKAFSEDLRGHC